MTPRPIRTPAERAVLLGHVGYEVWMTCEAGALLAEHLAHAARPDDPRGNALLESQLLHARSAVEFLLRNPRAPAHTDCLRSDFAPDWTPAPSDAAGRLDQHWPDLNDRLAHLSWNRLGPEKRWRYVRIGSDVLAVARSWREVVLTHYPALDTAALDRHLDAAAAALVRRPDPRPVGTITATTSSSLSVSRPLTLPSQTAADDGRHGQTAPDGNASREHESGPERTR